MLESIKTITKKIKRQSKASGVLQDSACLKTLKELLGGDLEFHGEDSSYASHNFHAFAAKFPPQLPAAFIKELTEPGDTVLDPMMGSGTTVLEAAIAGRKATGYDIDPLAILLCKVKTTKIKDIEKLKTFSAEIILRARKLAVSREAEIEIESRFDKKTKEFLNYWFLASTQRELMALLMAFECILINETDAVKNFFQLAFSSIIVTKSGGVTLARDLAHGRPHKVEDKKPKDAIDQFRQRVQKNIKGIEILKEKELGNVKIKEGDARCLKTQEGESVKLVVTSPPYANAIDYMRAHKYSLSWFGHPIGDLSQLRATYIGSERINKEENKDTLPASAEAVVRSLKEEDRKQSEVLKKYFLEMQKVFKEIYRVLKPDSAAVVVVGSSTMRGIDVKTHECLADIAANLQKPFKVAGVVPRRLDRNKRMMPARFGGKSNSMIEQRMHEEFVIGLYKPGA